MKKVLPAAVLLICATCFGCKGEATNYRLQFVDRDTLSSHGLLPQPLMLIVEIEEDGALRLNKIDTGTTRDTSLLAEKLEVIFADREKAGINEREVVIDPKIKVESAGFEKLVKTLADLNASPIRVIKNNP